MKRAQQKATALNLNPAEHEGRESHRLAAAEGGCGTNLAQYLKGGNLLISVGQAFIEYKGFVSKD